jgi:hypothetical protein
VTPGELRDLCRTGVALTTAARDARSVVAQVAIAQLAEELALLAEAGSVPGYDDLRLQLAATARATAEVALGVAARWSGVRA